MSIIGLSMAVLPCRAEEDVEAGSAALRVDWPVYPRRAEHNTIAERGNRRWAETARQNRFQSRSIGADLAKRVRAYLAQHPAVSWIEAVGAHARRTVQLSPREVPSLRSPSHARWTLIGRLYNGPGRQSLGRLGVKSLSSATPFRVQYRPLGA